MTDAELIARLRDYSPENREHVVHRAADRIEALIAEVAALKHDIERHIQIAADLANENEELRERIRALLTETAGESPAPPRP